MNYIWRNLENKNWKAATKYRVLLWILGTIFGVTGLILWFLVRIWALNSLDWMFCFIGYPVIISWFSVVFYSFNHDFHDGNHLQNKRDQ